MSLRFEYLDRQKHKREGFCCGNESLNKHILQQATQDIKNRVAAVKVLLVDDNPQVVGFYSLSSYTVSLGQLRESDAKRLPRYPNLPATLLGRLAVDKRYQGRKYGELLLLDALATALATSEKVASLAVVVDAIDEAAANFYAKYGFIPLRDTPLKLYLPMKIIVNLLT